MPDTNPTKRCRLLSAALAFLLLGTAVTAAGAQTPVQRTASFDDSQLAAAAHGVAPGSTLEVRDVPLISDQLRSTLVLQRFEVFTPDARVHVDNGFTVEVRQPMRSAYFRGKVAGEDSSFAVMTAEPGGAVRAIVAIGERLFVASPPDAGSKTSAPLVAREVDPQVLADKAADWTCAQGELNGMEIAGGTFADKLTAGEADPALKPKAGPYAVDVAVDTDYEYYQLLGSEALAVGYIGDIFAATSAIYQRDVDTFVQISDIYLYTTPADPWTAGDTLSALFELRDYWQINRGDVARTTVHLMSGKNVGGGIAYLGTLCSTSAGYGVSMGLDGNYSASNPFVVWDIDVVTHELGHNFSSPHTHCYNPPVDMCYGSQDGCYSGSPQLPPDGGSIMSYCHLLGGGFGNISLYLGRAGFYGNQSERVNEQITGYLEAISSCLPEPIDLIFTDGFETGNANNWSNEVF